MGFGPRDAVVLERDLPVHSLKKGDIGAIVGVCGGEGIEVEFFTGGGRSRALLALSSEDIRPVGDADVLTVRPLELRPLTFGLLS